VPLQNGCRAPLCVLEYCSYFRVEVWQENIVNKQVPFPRIVLAFLTGLLLVSLAFGSGFVVASFQPRQSQSKAVHTNSTLPNPGPLSIFQEAWDLIERDFFGSLPTNRERVYGAVRGLLETVDDPYTTFVEPIPRRFEQDDLRGSYGGIGVALNRAANGQVVLSPFRDSPAAQAGILEGDVLLAVDDVRITPEMDVSQEVTALIRGEVGTTVTLIIHRGAETLTFSIARQAIEIPSVAWHVLDQAPNLGYVQVSSFTDRTADELKDALDELLEGDMDGLVLDLRNNGGGLLQAAIDVTDQFIDGGVVLYERRKGQEEKSYVANQGELAPQIPLVVLVNHGTASASEIVAGAIQDHERGLLVGEPTFGKGSVQLIFDLSDGSSLHVTAARWYTPDRHQLDSVGLTPNLSVDADPQSDSDAQLETAITYLQSGQ
jgi:carboxyl-terminal processing protease